MKKEPALIVQLIQTALVALVGVLSAFDVWTPTEQQLAALTTLYVALAAVLTYWLRKHVTPVRPTLSIPPPPPPGGWPQPTKPVGDADI